MRNRSRKPEQYEAELACPPLPRDLVYVWQMFSRLRNRAGGNGFGVNPIAFSEIEAFCRLSGTSVTPFELRLIEDLDNLFRKPRKPHE